jgi:hypothetical protein
MASASVARRRPEEKVTQRLRCYAPDDLERLLDSVGLSLVATDPGSARLEESRADTAVIRKT